MSVDPHASTLQQLWPVASDELSDLAGPQEWATSAPLLVFIVVDEARYAAAYGDNGLRLALLEAGAYGQLLASTATTLGIERCMMGRVGADATREVLGLMLTEQLVLSIAFGLAA